MVDVKPTQSTRAFEPCLHCGKTLNLQPGFALKVLGADGTVQGYVHPMGDCKEAWLKDHPGYRCEMI
jgi:hypothetical protein